MDAQAVSVYNIFLGDGVICSKQGTDQHSRHACGLRVSGYIEFVFYIVGYGVSSFVEGVEYPFICYMVGVFEVVQVHMFF